MEEENIQLEQQQEEDKRQQQELKGEQEQQLDEEQQRKQEQAQQQEQKQKQEQKQEQEQKQKLKETIRKIKDTATEEDSRPTSQLSLRTILGGDLLNTDIVRSQIWLFVLIVSFATVYVAFRYQCQQDMITIDKMEKALKDAKFKALSSSSQLTEKCRESHVLDILKQDKDSLLHQADQPPYIIEVPEQ